MHIGRLLRCVDVPTASSRFRCRTNITDCDAQETCDGVSIDCPIDGYRPRNYVCRASKGLCDPEETCDGTPSACGPDVLQPRGFVCRAKEGPCDVADLCPGGDAQCPPDAKEVIDTPCNVSKGICDIPELCDGLSKLCPPDEFRPASANFICRDPNGDCDLPERCDGTSANCPVDKFSVDATCRPAAPGNTCDVPEVCGNSADCPPDGFLPFNHKCDDSSELTSNDVCDNMGVCSGKCLVDMACNDRNPCTEDTCTMETGSCIFTPIAGCLPEAEATPTPPISCLFDKSFCFDFLTKQTADTLLSVCFFNVSLTPINGSSVVRTFSDNNNTYAVSFGIVPLGDDGSGAKDAKIRATTALMMRFPPTWNAAIESVSVSSVGIDTVLAVVRDAPESQRANIDMALSAFDDSGGNSTVTAGVWLIVTPGEHSAPPIIRNSTIAAWTVMHLRGPPFSLDVVRLTRPINDNGDQWQAAPGGTTVLPQATAAPDSAPAVDGVLIGSVIGGVIGGLLLLCGTFAAGVWWSRRGAHNADKNPTGGGNDSRPNAPTSRAEYASIAVLPQKQNDYEMLEISPKPPGTDYVDGSELHNS